MLGLGLAATKLLRLVRPLLGLARLGQKYNSRFHLSEFGEGREATGLARKVLEDFGLLRDNELAN